ncbi:MAG TPA: ATP-binding protein, partial [Verrucomicrobiae bacterium]|nr:ATP-binding protein [Verrucomicrobiae bacterium]
MGSPVLLNHVLVNLFDNALKFMPADRNPCITVRSSRTEGAVRLLVSDNGIGIAPEYHAKIFDLFARLHKPSEYSGTGIGLALVKRAMDRMMGKVGLESTPGQGSCFWLEFRAAK